MEIVALVFPPKKIKKIKNQKSKIAQTQLKRERERERRRTTSRQYLFFCNS
jgi:hypothetical protein